jgi:hypothetical protein
VDKCSIIFSYNDYDILALRELYIALEREESDRASIRKSAFGHVAGSVAKNLKLSKLKYT